jgi:putative transposase
MTVLDLYPGSVVGYKDQNWELLATFGTDRACIRSANRREKCMVPISDLKPPLIIEEQGRQMALPLEPSQLTEARKWMECVRPLLNRADRSPEVIRSRAVEYKVHPSTIYRRLAAWDLHGREDALVPMKSGGGRGKSRLRPDVDELITSSIESHYLNKQRLKIKDVGREVRRACDIAGLPAPHVNTIARRVHQISAEVVARKRKGKKAAERFQPRPTRFEGATYPLSIVEIDHTKLDVILVDDIDRRPTYRPWITLGFDVYSRMVTGFYISLDPVGANSTGLCIAHSMTRKDTWLLERGIEGDWPCWGRMACIHVDNAKEFRGDMLRCACERYGIELNFRPVGQPHFGGHVERFYRTLNDWLHKLPGTTFSNVPDKGEYPSAAKACFTLGELEQAIGRWIVEIYHNQFHRGIQKSPLKRFTEGFNGRSLPPVLDPERLQKDFMPVEYRTIQRTGVEIDYIRYYGPELNKWIGTREEGKTRSRQFSFARDPRDISRVFFLDPEDNEYRKIPYLDTSRGPMSIWELREANRKLVAEGRQDIDENLLVQKHLELTEQARSAVKRTRVVRRRLKMERKRTASSESEQLVQEPEVQEASADSVEPFDSSPVLPFRVEQQ